MQGMGGNITETSEHLNIKKWYYLFTIFLHFKSMRLNLELFGAEQVSAIYYNEQTILFYNFFLNVDVYSICSLITHFWEFILLFCLEYFKDSFDTQVQLHNNAMLPS